MSQNFDLDRFSIGDVLACSEALKAGTAAAQSMEEIATRSTSFLYQAMVDRRGERACALVRFYTTLPYAALDLLLRAQVRVSLGDLPPSPDMKCLTLLGTAGDESAWNSRKTSVGHQVIPLPNPEIVRASPMISQLMQQFGLDLGAFLTDDPTFTLTSKRTYNVFYVPDARASPFVPAQSTFVIPYRIRSAVGFGGLLPSGNLFAIVLFTKIPVSREVAELFRSLALTVRGLLLPHDAKTIFTSRKPQV